MVEPWLIARAIWEPSVRASDSDIHDEVEGAVKRSDVGRACLPGVGRRDEIRTVLYDRGKVTAVETADDWNVDLSKLFVGLRFAHGAHSRLYHGKYEDEPVAVKIIRVPDDDENGTLATRLEKQFTREVTLLSRLHHPNVIKVIQFV